MTEFELKEYLVKNYPQETEDCEWKEYSNLKHVVKGHEGDDIVSYVSAISNMNGGCLVIGVKDGTLDITGIQNFHSYTSISIKSKLLQHCTNLPSEGLEIEEYVTDDTGKTVWVIKIPKHSLRLPVYVHGKAWQRYGDSLDEMDATRKDAILDEISTIPDWSAEIIADASLDDLDPEAILKARKEYVKRNPTRAEDEKDWDTITFLNKAKLTRAGKITRTALILLGKEESEHLLSPYVIKIRWSLKNLQNENKDYDILSMPLILSVDTLFNKVRNVKYRFVREGTMFPDEMLRYDVFNIREPLHNCIAHQDYSQCARIEVIEYEDDHLVFQNSGTFLPESVETVIVKDCPESVYRNRFLVEAMRNLNMIETEGGGIKKMFKNQKARLFPMPEYDLSGGKVKVTITGRVIDEEFANILLRNPELTLYQVMLLDKVQKKKSLTDSEIALLKKLKFIEGRKPNFFLSDKVVKLTEDEKLKADYIKNKSFGDDYYRDLILKYIRKYHRATKDDISALVLNLLPPILSSKQKASKVTNLLSSLRIRGLIEYKGGFWVLKN